MEHSLTPIQEKLLESLKWFDDFCKKNNLRYYAIGGTILGAMRHQGFIPWDDDIDLGMPRSDYEKLKQISSSIIGRFKIETYESDASDYSYLFTKLYDTSTTLIEQKRVDIVRGVYIDIFPLDGIGNSEKEVIGNYKKIRNFIRFFEATNTSFRKERSWIKNTAILVCKLIPSFLIDQRSMRIKLNRICAKNDFDRCKFGGNLFGAYWEREIIDLSLFGTPKYYPFENIMIAGPQDADAYLTSIYRDWHKLPPKDKQVSHHNFICLDLENSYLNRI